MLSQSPNNSEVESMKERYNLFVDYMLDARAQEKEKFGEAKIYSYEEFMIWWLKLNEEEQEVWKLRLARGYSKTEIQSTKDGNGALPKLFGWELPYFATAQGRKALEDAQNLVERAKEGRGRTGPKVKEAQAIVQRDMRHRIMVALALSGAMLLSVYGVQEYSKNQQQQPTKPNTKNVSPE